MAAEYARAYKGLKRFLYEHGAPSPAALAELHPRDYNQARSGWIQFCYTEDMTHGYALAGLLRFVELHWWVRPNLKPTGDLVHEWESREPVEHRTPAPALLVQAVVGVALAWGWNVVAALIWLDFHCLLRLGEGCALLCGDFEFVEIGSVRRCVVTVTSPKTRRRFARVQHVIVDEEKLVDFLALLLEGRDSKERFYSFTSGTFASRLEVMLEKLGAAGAFTVGGLRAGGATYEWVVHRNFDALRLRGHWVSSRTLEAYIQETATQLGLGRFSESKRQKFRRIAEDGMELLEDLVYR